MRKIDNRTQFEVCEAWWACGVGSTQRVLAKIRETANYAGWTPAEERAWTAAIDLLKREAPSRLPRAKKAGAL